MLDTLTWHDCLVYMCMYLLFGWGQSFSWTGARNGNFRKLGTEEEEWRRARRPTKGLRWRDGGGKRWHNTWWKEKLGANSRQTHFSWKKSICANRENRDDVWAEQRTRAGFSPSLNEPGSRRRGGRVMREQSRGGWCAGRNRRKGRVGWGMSEDQCKYSERKRKKKCKESQRNWKKAWKLNRGEEKKHRKGKRKVLKAKLGVGA